MGIVNIGKEELISAIRGLNIKDYSIRELEHLTDLFKTKARQIESEINKRKIVAGLLNYDTALIYINIFR